MIIKRIKRKIYKAFHPAIGEVWMLHRVTPDCSEDPKQRELEVTPLFLEQKILEYKSRGYVFVSMDEVVRRIESLKKTSLGHFGSLRRLLGCLDVIMRKKKFVAVTLDDGYKDNYQYAYPVFQRNKVPFIIYVTTQFIDNKIDMWWYPGKKLGMNSAELIELDNDPLCTIGAHTMTHICLECCPKEKQYEEIINSKETLEQLLNHKINHFSYPYGDYNDDTLDILKISEMDTSVLVSEGKIRCDKSLFQIPRIPIKQE